MKKIRVRLPHDPYDILVGGGIAANPATWKRAPLKTGRAFLFADARLRGHEQSVVRALSSAGWKCETVRIAAAEALKDISRIYSFYGKLLKLKADRHCTIFALGGGTIGDAIGFLAGTYLRGVRWVGLPTTLLAQVDSAIGGKTGVNHDLGKNLIGVFHQPSLVVSDTRFLDSLSRRDRLSGLGEMIKYALVYDPALWKLFTDRWEDILELKPDVLEKSVGACAKWKARVVAKDERDLLGAREQLNFGHTVAHALEAETRYGYLRHGEAVILGMRAAVALSLARGHLKRSSFVEIDGFLSRLEVPRIPARVTGRRILAQIGFDKKARNGKVRYVLLKKIGRTISDPRVRDSEVLKSLEGLGIKRG